jgi:hypothetical protein
MNLRSDEKLLLEQNASLRFAFFLDVTSCELVNSNVSMNLHASSSGSVHSAVTLLVLLGPEDEVINIVRNVVKYEQIDTAYH